VRRGPGRVGGESRRADGARPGSGVRAEAAFADPAERARRIPSRAAPSTACGSIDRIRNRDVARKR